MRVFTPGSTLYGAWPKYSSHIRSSVCCTGGTTFESATPWRSDGWMPRVRSSVPKKIPYSSAVCSRRLVRRQDTRSRSPSNTPILVLVFPTSATSSIGRPPPGRRRRPGDLPRDDPPSAVNRVLHEKRAVRVDADDERRSVGTAARFEQDSTELSPARQHVVGPLEPGLEPGAAA